MSLALIIFKVQIFHDDELHFIKGYESSNANDMLFKALQICSIFGDKTRVVDEDNNVIKTIEAI